MPGSALHGKPQPGRHFLQREHIDLRISLPAADADPLISNWGVPVIDGEEVLPVDSPLVDGSLWHDEIQLDRIELPDTFRPFRKSDRLGVVSNLREHPLLAVAQDRERHGSHSPTAEQIRTIGDEPLGRARSRSTDTQLFEHIAVVRLSDLQRERLALLRSDIALAGVHLPVAEGVRGREYAFFSLCLCRERVVVGLLDDFRRLLLLVAPFVFHHDVDDGGFLGFEDVRQLAERQSIAWHRQHDENENCDR